MAVTGVLWNIYGLVVENIKRSYKPVTFSGNVVDYVLQNEIAVEQINQSYLSQCK